MQIHDKPVAAPPYFPYRDHGTLREVWDEQILDLLEMGFKPEAVAETTKEPLEYVQELAELLEVRG